MQSLLAYRRFGKTVREQYERDRKRAEALQRGNAEAATPAGASAVVDHRRLSVETASSENVPSSQLAASHLSDTRDLEKAEPTHGTGEDDLKRQETATSVRSFGLTMGNALSGIEVRTLTREMSRIRSRKVGHLATNTEKDHQPEIVFVVGYENEKDPMNPYNWTFALRMIATLLIGAISFVVGFASSIDSAASRQASAEFGVSDVTEALATGIYLIGFGVGALSAGPVSETVGRNPVYIVTLFIYMCFILGAALAPNIGTQLVMRFLAGFFGSAPLVCAGGSLSDIWSPMERNFAFPIFATAGFLGPVLGPVVGGFVGQSSLVSWRWTEWITLIISGTILVGVLLFQPETYAPILLKWKASHLRELTGDKRYVSAVEIRADPFGQRLLRALYRPFILASREPIVMLFALYLTVIYIILFTFLDGYSYIFGDTYGFSEGITGLAFVGMGIGFCCTAALVPLIHHWAKRELLALQAKEGPTAKLAPEHRLHYAMLGAPAVPISLFWMGWTANPNISYWSPLVASVLFGYGILCIFISTYQYIIDSYELYAASALASLTVIRYVVAGGMVEVGIPFYGNLGVHWTLTIMGAISAVMVPVPYAFYKWGPKIRGYSKFAAGGI
ncbi:MFS general substrate transporter-46 [Coleophoma crateriformis]|uniref:MFS general substrate transporter-46 n=1 Tax=Coleophoma crateriformis TaxID=565419 RepID=A0A3D8SMR9_9HELO|nr:MFS general substrate transporter-46 [Coleophoma crateriformis]